MRLVRSTVPVGLQRLLAMQGQAMTARIVFALTVLAIVLLALLLAIHVGRKAQLEVESHGSEVGLVVPGPALEPTTTTAKPVPTTSTTARARTAPIQAASVAPARPVAVGEIADMIRAEFSRFGPGVAEEAVRVAQCESHLNPRATNGQHASLFQISRTYHEARARRLGFTWDRMWEPAVNIAVAVDIYSESKWRPWTCQP